MKVGDLVRYTYKVDSLMPQVRGNGSRHLVGVVVKVDGDVIWFTPFCGKPSTMTHIKNLELISESR